MGKNYVLNKLMRALNTLSDSELSRLAALFSQPSINIEFVTLIESTLALRKAERSIGSEKLYGAIKNNLKGKTQSESEVSAQIDHRIHSFEDVQNTFTSLLVDKKLFRSTKDVVDAVNTSFSCDIDYEKYRRRGRKPVIKKCLKYLSGQPLRKQIGLMRSFLQKISEESKALDQYRELFGILAGYD